MQDSDKETIACHGGRACRRPRLSDAHALNWPAPPGTPRARVLGRPRPRAPYRSRAGWPRPLRQRAGWRATPCISSSPLPALAAGAQLADGEEGQSSEHSPRNEHACASTKCGGDSNDGACQTLNRLPICYYPRKQLLFQVSRSKKENWRLCDGWRLGRGRRRLTTEGYGTSSAERRHWPASRQIKAYLG